MAQQTKDGVEYAPGMELYFTEFDDGDWNYYRYNAELSTRRPDLGYVNEECAIREVIREVGNEQSRLEEQMLKLTTRLAEIV